MLRSLSPIKRIPRELLYITLDDLPARGIPKAAQDALRALVADLPLVPDAAASAQLIGEQAIALPCLAVLARHIVQGLRDHNLTLAHDRPRLRTERRKLLFLDSESLREARSEAVVCLVDACPAVVDQLRERDRLGLATFITAATPIMPWRQITLRSTP